jgi:carbon storage regulator
VLIIRRRRGESIVIGENIEIEILETSPTQVKLGISAPKDVTVLRSEIRVTRDVNRAASSQAADPEKLSLLVEQLRETTIVVEPLSPESSAVVVPDEEKSNNP